MSGFDPKDIHNKEQRGAALRDIAALLRDYYSHLILEGFNQEQALAIVVGFQSTYFGVALTSKDR